MEVSAGKPFKSSGDDDPDCICGEMRQRPEIIYWNCPTHGARQKGEG